MSIRVRRVLPTECVEFVMQAIAHEVGDVRVDVILEVLEEWTLAGIFNDMDLIGMIACDGAGDLHMHVATAWHGRWHPRTSIRHAIDLLHERHEVLHMHIPQENKAAIKSALLVAAVEVARNEKDVTYRLERKATP